MELIILIVILYFLYCLISAVLGSKSNNNNPNSNLIDVEHDKHMRNAWNMDFEGNVVDPESPWGKIRQEVFKRDLFRCTYCGFNRNLTVNHKIPLKFGGTNDITNLETLCKKCHEDLHNRSIFDPKSNFKDIDNYGSDPHLTKKVKIIVDAINNSDYMTIDYVDKKGSVTHRKITPKNLFEEHNRIYLRSFCYLRNEERTFRISRITIK